MKKTNQKNYVLKAVVGVMRNRCKTTWVGCRAVTWHSTDSPPNPASATQSSRGPLPELRERDPQHVTATLKLGCKSESPKGRCWCLGATPERSNQNLEGEASLGSSFKKFLR